jgi:hypothetical protein
VYGLGEHRQYAHQLMNHAALLCIAPYEENENLAPIHQRVGLSGIIAFGSLLPTGLGSGQITARWAWIVCMDRLHIINTGGQGGVVDMGAVPRIRMFHLTLIDLTQYQSAILQYLACHSSMIARSRREFQRNIVTTSCHFRHAWA